MSTSVTIYASSGDGHMYARTADHFSNARDAASAYSKDIAGDTLRVGLAYINPPNPGDRYRFYRGYLYFDTSSIPANATILSASVSLYLNGLLRIITGGFDIYLLSGQPDHPGASLALADFDRTLYAGGGANPASVATGQSGYAAMTFTAAGLANWINKEGTSKFCVRTSLDITPTVPNLYMLADFYSSEKGGGYRPKLVITYGTKPTVTTDAASGLGSSYATGNGTINTTGDSAITEYGVIWNDDGSDPVDIASADHKSTGSDLAGGTFTAAITGLSASTSYYYRAYATNGSGTSYGDAVQFTTSAPAAEFTVTTQDATAVTDTTATCHGTVVEDEGYSITQRGVVYKKGGDPGTPANPTTAEGYTQEGAGSEGAFSSDIASLDESSIYLCRAYAQTTDDGGHIVYGGIVVIRTGIETNTTIDGDTGDGSLYTYGIWTKPPLTSCGAGDYRCTDDQVAEIEHSDCGLYGGNYSYPNRAILLTNETEIDLYSSCDDASNCWECHLVRGFLYFDTSSLTGKTITSATLKLYVTYSSYTTYTGSGYVSHGQGFKVGQDGAGTYPTESGGSPALEAGDFDKNHYYVFATVSSATMEGHGAPGAVNAYISVSIPTNRINKTGLTKLCIMLYDTGEFGSSYGEHLKFQTANGANKPYLDIDYVESATAPNYPKINVGDELKEVELMMINVGNEWKTVTAAQINIGDAWKDLAA